MLQAFLVSILMKLRFMPCSGRVAAACGGLRAAAAVAGGAGSLPFDSCHHRCATALPRSSRLSQRLLLAAELDDSSSWPHVRLDLRGPSAVLLLKIVFNLYSCSVMLLSACTVVEVLAAVQVR